jgi:orotidine-5'-phosphate decarboxylase
MMPDLSPEERIKERIIVALDLPSIEEAQKMVDDLEGHASFFKIGYQLIYQSGGIEFAKKLKKDGYKVFLDAKLHDIGATVENAVAMIADLGVDFLTIHTTGKMIDAASIGRRRSGNEALKILAVTVLTDMDEEDLWKEGFIMTAEGIALNQASLVIKNHKVDGVICSAHEVGEIRELANRRLGAGSGFLIVTPGIRLPGQEKNDQKRIATPLQAIDNGADYLVVGRPITKAQDPESAKAAFDAICADMI